MQETMKVSEWEPWEFCKQLKQLQTMLYENSVSHGFWAPSQANFAAKIALVHSELSEMLEKHRKTVGKGLPDEPDDHCPEFGGIAIEAADVAIRLMDLCENMGINLGEAIIAKAIFNESRPAKHGKAY